MRKIIIGAVLGSALTGMVLNTQNVELTKENEAQQIELNRLGNEVSELKLSNNQLKVENAQLYWEMNNKWTSLGEFKVTYYCPCEECSGIWGTTLAYPCDGSHKAKVNHSVAVDKNLIPIGSVLKINGKEFVAEDVGGAVVGKVIDIFVLTHEETLTQPFDRMEVFIKNEWNLEIYWRLWRIIWSK